jgi:hypothetical protein
MATALSKASDDKFVLSLLSEEDFDSKLPVLLRYLSANYRSVCFVSSTLTWEMFAVLSKRIMLPLEKFVFIDTLSSHYEKKRNLSNVFFVEGPHEMRSIKERIMHSVGIGCNAVLFDSITNFWSDWYFFELMALANSFRMDPVVAAHPKCFCFVKSAVTDDYMARIKDFYMFADTVVNLDSKI